MISPGAIYLRLHQKFSKGLRVAWYRDYIRPKILETPPVTETIDHTCEIHALTCASDWLNLIWALKSFYIVSGRRYMLCIHEDGTLSEDMINALKIHFPRSRLIRRSEADSRIRESLQEYPQLLNFRTSNLLAPKIVDFRLFLTVPRMLIFDSDLLFFDEPTDLLECIEDPTYLKNLFNSDFGDGYTLTSDVVQQNTEVNLKPLINSGLGLVHQDSIRWDWLEEFLKIPGILDGHFWRIEQTLFALCSSRFGVELLPEEYKLYLAKGINGRRFRHYVGVIRHLMYSEGIPNLIRSGVIQI